MIKRSHKFIYTIVLTLCSVAVLMAFAAYYLIGTAAGAKALINYAILQSAPYGTVSIQSFSGTIADGLVLKNVEIRNWPLLGPGTVILLQKVNIQLPIKDWHKMQVNIFNGRLDLPKSDPAVFSGQFADAALQGAALEVGFAFALR